MKRRALVAAWLIIGVGCAAGAPAEPRLNQSRVEGPQRVALTVHPVTASRPALKDALLHEALDQKPGNAALMYERVRAELAGEQFSKDRKKLGGAWLKLPLDELPLEEMRATLRRYALAIRGIERGSLCRRCEWQTNWREEGLLTLSPHLLLSRDLAYLLAAQIRYEIADGQLDQAMHHLRVGFTMAQHLGRGETLIEGLVAAAIGTMMLDRVREVMVQERSPSLYWPLTDLPTPFIDLRVAVRGEKWLMHATSAQLLEAHRGAFSAEQWHGLFDEMDTLAFLTGLDELPKPRVADTKTGKRLIATAVAIANYPQAKRDLVRNGRSVEQVQAMPVAESLLTALLEDYETHRDEMFKWYVLPYWQAEAGLERFDANLRRLKPVALGLFMARWQFAGLTAGRYAHAKLDRQIALARCVAMIRLHAGAHDGQLPASLEDVDDAVVPIDPVTGRPFDYRVADGRAIITAPAPRGQPVDSGYVYEIRIAGH